MTAKRAGKRSDKDGALWVYASHSAGSLDRAGLEIVTKGRDLADRTNMRLEVLLIGHGVRDLASTLEEYGADAVLLVDHERFSSFSTRLHAFAISELAKERKPSVLLMGGDNRTAAVAARAAARLKTGLGAHCIDIALDPGGQLVQTVPAFQGDVMATFLCPDTRPQMATIMPGVIEAKRRPMAGSVVEEVSVEVPKDLRCPEEIEVVEAEGLGEALEEAEVVVAGGFGAGNKEGWQLVEGLARELNAAVGATRPPVDEGWAEADQMIGQSGKTIRPKLYLALGISGLMHHTVGVQNSKTIVAVNNDRTAPIFSMADFGIVGDLREVVPAIIRELRQEEDEEVLEDVGWTKTPDEYKESLRKLRPNIHKFGRLVEDVTTDPVTKRTVEGHAQTFAAGREKELQDLVTTTSSLTGERISRYLSLIRGPEDMHANSRMKRLMFNLTGSCTGGRCAGWTSINAMWATTYDMDKDLGTDYHQRLRDWLIDAQRRDITLSGALTDPKGHRRLRPSQQPDPDMYLHIVERRPDGIVVRGAKAMICGIAAANEVFVLPGGALRAPDADYAVSFAIPKDVEGLKIVEARHPSDRRELEEGFDIPVNMGGITQAYLFFEDVFVAKERVFMCGEYRYAMSVIMNFTLPYRAAIGGCVAGQGDLMIGAAILIARANGLDEKVFRDKLVQMIINNETTFAVGLGAASMGTKHPSGVWVCDPVIANVNKVHVATLPYETKRLTQEIAGGIAETGCMPSYEDLMSSEYGHLIRKYLKAASPAETRMKIARLIEWLTLGAGVPGCMHGGGSPDGARMVIGAKADFDRFIDLAKRVAEISDITLAAPPPRRR